MCLERKFNGISRITIFLLECRRANDNRIGARKHCVLRIIKNGDELIITQYSAFSDFSLSWWNDRAEKKSLVCSRRPNACVYIHIHNIHSYMRERKVFIAEEKGFTLARSQFYYRNNVKAASFEAARSEIALTSKLRIFITAMFPVSCMRGVRGSECVRIWEHWRMRIWYVLFMWWALSRSRG